MIDKGSIRLAFIVNPAARNHRSLKTFNKILPVIRAHIPDFKVYVAEYGDELDRSVQLAKDDGCTYFIACGGDGTVHQLANILANSELKMGILPLGSGNDVAYTLGYPTDIKEVLAQLLTWQDKSIDLIHIDDRYVINTAGIGLDGYINHLASSKFYRFKAFRYLFSGIYALSDYKIQTFEIASNVSDAMIQDAWMVCLANGKREGGRYLISPDSVPDDGQFEFLILQPVSRLRLIIAFIKLSLGLPFNRSVVKSISVSEVRISMLNGCHIHTDGESLQADQELNAKIVPKALRVLRP